MNLCICIQKLSYRDNWETWNGCSVAGLRRCFLGPRELPWFIHGFRCQVRCGFQTGFPVGAAQGVEMKEEEKMRKKRGRNLRKALNCTIFCFKWFGFCKSDGCRGIIYKEGRILPFLWLEGTWGIILISYPTPYTHGYGWFVGGVGHCLLLLWFCHQIK